MSLPWLSVAGKLKQWIFDRAGHDPGTLSKTRTHRRDPAIPRSSPFSIPAGVGNRSRHRPVQFEAREFRPVFEVDLETCSKIQEVDRIAAARRGHDDMVAFLAQGVDRAFEMKMRLFRTR